MSESNSRAGRTSWERETHKYDFLHVRLRLILGEVLRCDPGAVLELGCGIGVLKRELLRRLPHLSYYGCDLSRSAVEMQNDRRVVCIDLNTQPLPFPGCVFSCVIASGVFEYLRDVQGILARLRLAVDERGRLVVSYFTMGHLYRRLQAITGGSPFRHPGWINDYSLPEFRALLGSGGWSILDEIPSSLGLCSSPPVGSERWGPAVLRCVRRFPLIDWVSHQKVFVCEPGVGRVPPHQGLLL